MGVGFSSTLLRWGVLNKYKWMISVQKFAIGAFYYSVPKSAYTGAQVGSPGGLGPRPEGSVALHFLPSIRFE